MERKLDSALSEGREPETRLERHQEGGALGLKQKQIMQQLLQDGTWGELDERVEKQVIGIRKSCILFLRYLFLFLIIIVFCVRPRHV